jgi:hypothetical protein
MNAMKAAPGKPLANSEPRIVLEEEYEDVDEALLLEAAATASEPLSPKRKRSTFAEHLHSVSFETKALEDHIILGHEEQRITNHAPSGHPITTDALHSHNPYAHKHAPFKMPLPPNFSSKKDR